MQKNMTKQDKNEIRIPSAQQSRSEKKRRMLTLQKTGEMLIYLSEDQLEHIHLPEDLHKAVVEARRLQKNRAAFKRQRQFIGRLMRQVDTEAIEEALVGLEAQHSRESARLHQIERWRDRLLSAQAASALTELIGQYPRTDRQRLHQLLQKAGREKQSGSGKRAQRELFAFLRELTSTFINKAISSESPGDLAH